VGTIRGDRHHWAGARLPRGPRESLPDEGLADPAKGERVVRCLTCGTPSGKEPILEFELLLMPGRKRAGAYRLCGRCYRHANPPPVADPLDVTTAA
jgi:hypothetical protein